MNKWEVDEHRQWSERQKPLLDKNRNYEGI